MQSMIYTHGTALQVEDPAQLAGFAKVGWGAQIWFVPPRPGMDARMPEAWETRGPGSWFHLPLTSAHDPGIYTRDVLTHVTLVLETTNCSITAFHVYDGPTIVEQVSFHHEPPYRSGMQGDFSKPFTHELKEPHKLRFAVGLSFFACSFFDDFRPRLDTQVQAPPAILTIAAGGATYQRDSLLERIVSDVVQIGDVSFRHGG